MASILLAASEKYKFLIHEKTDPRVREWLLMSSPVSTIILVSFYIYFVKVLGPKLMENRKPYDIKKIMIVYNLFQIIINAFLAIKALIRTTHDYQNILCSTPDYSNTPEGLNEAFTTYLYFISKVIDLLDTVFMILRKKFNQVTFLHVYHHSFMALISWVFVAYFAGGHAAYFGLVNTFIHVIMYTYYLVTAIYPEYGKSAWWKRHLTQLQLVQFVVVTIHTLLIVINPYCTIPKMSFAIFLPQGLVFYLLFWNFYQKAYKNKKVTSEEKQD